MDPERTALAVALRAAARRHGHHLSINGDDGTTGAFRVTLGRDGRGRLTMIRQGAPCEGGRTTLNYPDATLRNGELNPRTVRWIKEWATLELDGIAAYEAMLAAKGLEPDAFDAAACRMSTIALDALTHLGVDVAAMLSAALWTRDSRGYRTILNHEALAESFTAFRCRGEILVDDLEIVMAANRFTVEDQHNGLTMCLTFHDIRSPPASTLAAVVGRNLSDLIEIPGVRHDGTTVQEASIAGSSLDVVVNRTTATIARP